MLFRKPFYRQVSSTLQHRVGFVLLALALVIVFRPVLYHDFVVWDDDLHVYDNPRLQTLDWKQVRAFWRAPYAHLYIPLTYTAWAGVTWLTRALVPGPLSAGLFHRLNLLLHMGSVVVVYQLTLLLLRRHDHDPEAESRRIACAALSALLFGLHPLQVEAVAWVSGLKDVLCGWWALIAVWQYGAFVQASGRHRRCIHYGLATAAYGLALLSKPTAVVVPGIAGLIAVWGLQQRWAAMWKALIPWFGVAIGWCVWTKIQQPDTLLEYVTPWWDRPLIAADALAFYLRKLIWPANLVPDYGRTPQWVMAQAWSPVLLMVPVVLGLGLWYGRGALRRQRLAAGIFATGLLPVLGVIPFGFQNYSSVADRYVYLAMLGPALGFGWGLHRLRRWQIAGGAGLVLLTLLGWRSAMQVNVWRNTDTLFTHTLQVNPNSILAHNNLGIMLAQKGRLHDAMPHFHRALRLKPNHPESHYNLGQALALLGEWGAAADHYAAALRQRPNWPQARHNLGAVLAAQGRYSEAVAQYARALLAKPDSAEVYYDMGRALATQGRHGEAIVAYRAALQWRPAWPAPATRLAMLLAVQTPASKAAVAEALSLATQACRLTRYRDAMALYALAVAQHAAGQFAEAGRTVKQALEIARSNGNKTLAARIESRLSFSSQRELLYEGL